MNTNRSGLAPTDVGGYTSKNFDAKGGALGVALVGPGRNMLSQKEADQLMDCEQVIQRGLDGFLAVAGALVTIREGKLYRYKFATFEEYCQTRWEMSARRAQQILAGARVVEGLAASHRAARAADPTLPEKAAVPANERTARAVAAVPEGKRIEVWAGSLEEAKAQGRLSPTAKDVQKVAERVAPKVCQLEDLVFDHALAKGTIRVTKGSRGWLWAWGYSYAVGSKSYRPVEFHPSDSPATTRELAIELAAKELRDAALVVARGQNVPARQRSVAKMLAAWCSTQMRNNPGNEPHAPAGAPALPVESRGTGASPNEFDLKMSIGDALTDLRYARKNLKAFDGELGPSVELRKEMQDLFDMAVDLHKEWKAATSRWDIAAADRRIAKAAKSGWRKKKARAV